MNVLLRKPWRGRVGALLGIFAMAVSLRPAVSAVPPLLGTMGPELGFSAATIGALAMLPPVVFAGAGLITPRLIGRFGLEKVLVTAVVLAVGGQLARAGTGSVTPFLGLSAVVMAGYGLGNVVLPPLVKKYFPDRLGVVTAGYVTLLAVGTAASPQLAVPLAQLSGWRVSIGVWAFLSAAVLLPWAFQLRADRRGNRRIEGSRAPAAPPPATTLPAAGAGTGTPPRRLNPWRSRVAWGLAVFLAGNSAQTFVYFTWLPPYLAAAGVGTAAAGSALAYFAILGLPVSLLVPLVVPRLRHPVLAVLLFACCWGTGHLGLYLAPMDGTWLWVTFAGLGQGTFAIALLMMNLRSRTTYGAGVLSGFSQGLGYAGAGLAPLLFGILFEATGDWTASFGTLAVCLAVMITGALLIDSPRRIEDPRPTPAASTIGPGSHTRK